MTCLSGDEGQTQLNEKSVPYLGKLVLGHKDIFTIGDRSFRWEYPDDSPHLKKASSPKKRGSPNKKANYSPANSANSIAKKGQGYAAMTPKAKAAAVAAAANAAGTPTSGSKRVSFGPYISPEYIDKSLPPSTPVRKGATPNRDNSKIKATPSSLLKKSLLQKKTAAQEKSVLKRRDNDIPLVKENSGYRASPRTSPKSSVKRADVKITPKKSPKKTPVKTPKKTATPRKAETPKSAKKTLAKAKTPAKVATPKAATPRAATPRSTRNSPVKAATPKAATPKAKVQTKGIKRRASSIGGTAVSKKMKVDTSRTRKFTYLPQKGSIEILTLMTAICSESC